MSETISLTKKTQKKYTVLIENVKQKVKAGKIKIKEKYKPKRRVDHSGVVLLSHVPHGFYEDEMTAYFSQFGEVLHVTLCRSMKTGRSKGYAFIQFSNKEVAKIAAESMDNYLMFKKRLTAKFLTPSEVPKDIFKRKPISEQNIPLTRIRDNMNKKKNALITETKYKKKCRQRLGKLNKVSKKLAEMGINYKLDLKDLPANITRRRERNILKKNQDNGMKGESEASKIETKSPVKKERMKLRDRKEKPAKQLVKSSSQEVKQKKELVKTSEKGKKPTRKLVKSSDKGEKQAKKLVKSSYKGEKQMKKSLTTIKKAKTKLSTCRTSKRDVKKLKTALTEYMVQNFGNSKPVLRHQLKQFNSKPVFMF